MKKIDQDFIDTFIEINEAAKTDEAIGRAIRSLIDDCFKGSNLLGISEWSIS
jgi:hypothetical protein